jgi:hypothetical protein
MLVGLVNPIIKSVRSQIEDLVETELGPSLIKKQEINMILPQELQAQRFYTIPNFHQPISLKCTKAYSSRESTHNQIKMPKNLWCQLIPNRTVSLILSLKSRKSTSIWSYKSSRHGNLGEIIVQLKRIACQDRCPILPEAVLINMLNRWIKTMILCWFNRIIKQLVIKLFSQLHRCPRRVMEMPFNLQALKTFKWSTPHRV